MLTYLLAGAPWAVANLWDVTDKDIDRLSMQCMGMLLDSVDTNRVDGVDDVARALVLSRDVCKLKHIVGCAPVLYGIPVSLHSGD